MFLVRRWPHFSRYFSKLIMERPWKSAFYTKPPICDRFSCAPPGRICFCRKPSGCRRVSRKSLGSSPRDASGLSSLLAHFPSLNDLQTQVGTFFFSLKPVSGLPRNLFAFAELSAVLAPLRVIWAVHFTQRSWWDRKVFFSSHSLRLNGLLHPQTLSETGVLESTRLTRTHQSRLRQQRCTWFWRQSSTA